jgi:hypothetical protein
MVSKTPHTHPEPFLGFLAAVAGGACGIGLLFAGVQWFVVAPVLGGVVTVGLATYLGHGLAHVRLNAVLGWAFGFVILTWPLMLFAVCVVAMASSPGD